jgi:GxxExxY protein
LLYELERQGLAARRQVAIPVRYEELTIDNGYRVDLLIGGLVVVELKALEAILPVHRAQLLSYLRLGGFKLGYLLNLNVSHMRWHHSNCEWVVILCVLRETFATFPLKL